MYHSKIHKIKLRFDRVNFEMKIFLCDMSRYISVLRFYNFLLSNLPA